MIRGFRLEQSSSEKKPTPSVVENKAETQPIQKQAENTGSIVHKGFQSDDERQEMIKYAYSLGGIDFVKMIECENGNWNIGAVGDSGKAFGLCQININYHKLPEGYKENWKIQVETCYEKWKNHTVFYGPDRKIKGVKCSTYVSDRFILN